MPDHPRSKPYATPTLAVSGRVTHEVYRQLVAQAAERHLSISQYVAHQLHYAASCQRDLAELRRELRHQERRADELEQHLAQHEQEMAWCTGLLAEQVQGALRNLTCLRQLADEYGAKPVPLTAARPLGFNPSLLLAVTLTEQVPYHTIGDLAWRYAAPDQTHILIRRHVD